MRCVRRISKKIWFDKKLIAELGGVPSDAFMGFRTSSNVLSIYYFDDDIPLPRVLAALAATRDHLQELDFAEFPDSLLDDHNIKRELVAGETPDTAVNAKHVNLTNLTTDQVCGLVAGIAEKGEVRRLSKSLVRREIEVGLEKSFLQRGAMNVQLLETL